tara:strand:+ start:177 stop:311 length:135 start_codon:yes stop_codon:yes gene_type:complete
MLVACAKEEVLVLINLFPNKNIVVIPNGIPNVFFNAKDETKNFK